MTSTRRVVTRSPAARGRATSGGVNQRSPNAQWLDYPELGLTEEHIPDLIRMATDLDLHNLRQESPEVWAPLHAWRALAQLRAVEAAHPLVLLFEQLKDDDWLPEEFPTVFSMIGPGAIPMLERFLADALSPDFDFAHRAKLLTV